MEEKPIGKTDIKELFLELLAAEIKAEIKNIEKGYSVEPATLDAIRVSVDFVSAVYYP